MNAATSFDVSYRSVKVWRRNLDVFRHLVATEMIWPILEPVIILAALGFGLGTFVTLASEQDYVQFIVPGLIAAFPMWQVIFETSWPAYSRMETQKTYDAVMATPVSLGDVVAAELLWAATRGVIGATYIIVVALILTPSYDLIESPLVILALPVTFISGIMFGSMAMIATSLVRSISQLNYFVTVVVMPMFWVAGVFFPLEEMAQEVRVLSWFMPLTHVVDLQRGLTTGDLSAGLLLNLLVICLLGASFFLIALTTMRRRLIK